LLSVTGASDRILGYRFCMILPNANRAVVDIRKLRDYCLNLHYDEGKHKARLFVAALEMTEKDAETLREIVLDAIKISEVQVGRKDMFGQRYLVDFVAEWRNKKAVVQSGWLIEHQDDIPRLTTCYPI